MKRNGDNPDQLIFPILGRLTPRGDGTFHLAPILPQGGVETWVSSKQARQILGCDGRLMPSSTFYSLLEVCQHIRRRKPSPHRIEVNLKDMEAHLKAIEADPDYWLKHQYPVRQPAA